MTRKEESFIGVIVVSLFIMFVGVSFLNFLYEGKGIFCRLNDNWCKGVNEEFLNIYEFNGHLNYQAKLCVLSDLGIGETYNLYKEYKRSKIINSSLYTSIKDCMGETSVTNDKKDSPEIFCPADAKICPDGSSVGRTGPDCEFSECPPEASISSPGTMEH